MIFPTQKSEAFTLTELLVCISIIAVLALLLIPYVRNSVVQASRLKCLNNLRQIQSASTSFASENNGQFPNAERQFGFPHELKNFSDTIGMYLKVPREKIMFCTGDLLRVRNSTTNLYNTTYTTYQYFNYPAPFLGVFSTSKPDLSRINTAPTNVPLWGCLTAIKGGVTYAHNEPQVKKTISGMNVVFPDGHAAWVTGANLEIYQVKDGLSLYWPKPLPLQ